MLLAVKCPAIGVSLTGTNLVSNHLGYSQMLANSYLAVVFEVLEHFQCPATPDAIFVRWFYCYWHGSNLLVLYQLAFY